MSGTIVAADGTYLTFDAVVEEAFDPQQTITEFPVEDGAKNNDHIQRLPDEFVVTGLVTRNPWANTPRWNSDELVTAADIPTRLTDAIEFFELASQDVVTYQSVLRGDLDNYAIKAWPYKVTAVQSLTFMVTFKLIRKATSATAEIPREPAKVKPVKECGEQPTTAEVDATGGGDSAKAAKAKSELKSLAADGYDGLEAFTGGATSVDLLAAVP